jgi:hypothetical protein
VAAGARRRGGDASDVVARVVRLGIRKSGQISEVRLSKVSGGRPGGGGDLTSGRRKRAGMAVGLRLSDERFLQPGSELSGEKREERREDAGLLIAGLAVQRGLGFSGIKQRGRTPCSGWSPGERRGMTSRVEWSAGEDGLTGGAHVSAAGGEEVGTNSGLGDVGPWASSSAGPNHFPGPFSDFFISF